MVWRKLINGWHVHSNMGQEKKSPHLRKYLAVKLKDVALLFVGLFILFILVNFVGADNILPIMAEMNLSYFALLLASIPVYHLIWNYKWKILIDEFFHVKLLALIPIYFTGMFVNNLTPGHNIGGEPVRAYFLSKESGKPFSKCLATAVMDVGIHSLVFLLFSVFGIAYVLIFLDIPIIRWFLLGFLILFAFVVSFIIYARVTRDRKKGPRKWVEKWLRRFFRFKFVKKRFKTYEDFKKRVVEGFDRFVVSIKAMLAKKRRLAETAGLALVVLIIEYLQLYIIFLGLGEPVPFFKIVVVMVVATLVSYFAILPGGTGVVEATMFVLLTAMGIDLGVAAAATLIQRSIFYITSYGVGIISLNYLGLKHKENVNLT